MMPGARGRGPVTNSSAGWSEQSNSPPGDVPARRSSDRARNPGYGAGITSEYSSQDDDVSSYSATTYAQGLHEGGLNVEVLPGSLENGTNTPLVSSRLAPTANPEDPGERIGNPVSPNVGHELEIKGPESRARLTLTNRLIDIILLPENRITPHERDMTADILVEMLQEADFDIRQKCALRLSALRDVPADILRLLATDEIEIARPILQRSSSLDDAELRLIANSTSHEHRMTIAAREGLHSVLVEDLVKINDPDLTTALIRNPLAHFSKSSIETVLVLSKEMTSLIPDILKRKELKPSHALAMFWWAEHPQRVEILKRFSVERRVLQETSSDVFAIAASEGWQDASSRKALQFIERRQRNRAAIEKSPYHNLEHAVDAALNGMDNEIRAEIGFLAGIKPKTTEIIFTDNGGEGIAILCKATGLRRDAVVKLWRALGRPVGRPESPDIGLFNVLKVFDSLSVDRGQTVLRYWNFALSSAMPKVATEPLASTSDSPMSDLLVAQRTAMLVFGNRGDA